MDINSLTVLAVIGAMAINQLVMRTAGLRGRRWIFWALQGLNLGTGTAVLVIGLPGFENMRVVSWFIGLMFFFRVVQNNQLRVAVIRERQRGSRGKTSDREADLMAALERSEAAEEGGASDKPPPAS